MKKYLLPALILASTLGANAQVKEGRVVYERKINMHKRLPPEAEQMKAMIPEFQISKMELVFNGTQSMYKNLPDPQDEMPESSDGGRRMSFRFGGGANDETFRDYDKEQIVESRELGPKTYLIEDTLRPLKWKLEEDTMTINGYLCNKATTTTSMFGMGGGMRVNAGGTQDARPAEQNNADTSRRSRMMANIPAEQKVEAWFTTDVESSAGPDNYYGLPGLIMKLVVDEGTIVYTAQSIEKLEKAVVKVPTNGKKITREEYRKMVGQQMQGMGGRTGGQGRMIMIHQ